MKAHDSRTGCVDDRTNSGEPWSHFRKWLFLQDGFIYLNDHTLEGTMNERKDLEVVRQGSGAPLLREIRRIERLREDVLLLRFFLDRRIDLKTVIDEKDFQETDTALKDSLLLLEGAHRHTPPTPNEISEMAARLMQILIILVGATRQVSTADETGETPPCVSPESLRASLPSGIIADALGRTIEKDKKNDSSEAFIFIRRKIRGAVVIFTFAFLIHALLAYPEDLKESVVISLFGWVPPMQVLAFFESLPENLRIIITAFFWSLSGACVWILIRFRRFGSTYAFNPSHAREFKARIYSGTIVSSIILYFVFGSITGTPQNGHWKINLPLWAFVLGYASRLQINFLSVVIQRIEGAVSTVFPPRMGYPRTQERNEKNPEKGPEGQAPQPEKSKRETPVQKTDKEKKKAGEIRREQPA